MFKYISAGVFLVVLAVMGMSCGSSSSTSTESGGSEATRAGDIPQSLLGSGSGTVSIYAKSASANSPSTSVSHVPAEKTVSYGGGTWQTSEGDSGTFVFE